MLLALAVAGGRAVTASALNHHVTQNRGHTLVPNQDQTLGQTEGQTPTQDQSTTHPLI